MKKKEEPIRIAQIIGKWLGGGVEAVVMNYYRHLDHSKVQFDFICDDDSTNIPYDEIEKLGGKVILIPPYQKVFKYQKELRRVLRNGKYEIVHSHINTLSVFPLYAAKKVGVPVRIAHSHSTTNKKEWKKNLLKQVLRPFSKKYATNYMCCSELAGRWLFGDKAYDEGKVYLLNNAIEACEKCDSKKIIMFRFTVEDNETVLSVENSYNRKYLSYRGKEIVTNKRDIFDEHGVGIKNVVSIIDKYNGTYTIGCEDNKFYFSIVL